MLIGAELRACFFWRWVYFKEKMWPKYLLYKEQMWPKWTCLSASALVCMVEQSGQTRRDRSPLDKAGGLMTWTRSMWRARSWGPRMLWGGSLSLAFMPLLLPWRRINVLDRLANRTFSSRPIIPFLARHAQGLVVQGIEIQAGQAQSACNYMTLQSPQKNETWINSWLNKKMFMDTSELDMHE